MLLANEGQNWAGDLKLPAARSIVRTVRAVFRGCRVFREEMPADDAAAIDFTNMVRPPVAPLPPCVLSHHRPIVPPSDCPTLVPLSRCPTAVVSLSPVPLSPPPGPAVHWPIVLCPPPCSVSSACAFSCAVLVLVLVVLVLQQAWPGRQAMFRIVSPASLPHGTAS